MAFCSAHQKHQTLVTVCQNFGVSLFNQLACPQTFAQRPRKQLFHFKEMSRLLLLHLRSTAWLASYCWERDVMAFKLRPKHHCLWRIAVDVGMFRVNPRIFHCWKEESFLGKLKKIARNCHGSTVTTRSLQRYLIGLASHFFLNSGVGC